MQDRIKQLFPMMLAVKKGQLPAMLRIDAVEFGYDAALFKRLESALRQFGKTGADIAYQAPSQNRMAFSRTVRENETEGFR